MKLNDLNIDLPVRMSGILEMHLRELGDFYRLALNLASSMCTKSGITAPPHGEVQPTSMYKARICSALSVSGQWRQVQEGPHSSKSLGGAMGLTSAHTMSSSHHRMDAPPGLNIYSSLNPQITAGQSQELKNIRHFSVLICFVAVVVCWGGYDAFLDSKFHCWTQAELVLTGQWTRESEAILCWYTFAVSGCVDSIPHQSTTDCSAAGGGTIHIHGLDLWGPQPASHSGGGKCGQSALWWRHSHQCGEHSPAGWGEGLRDRTCHWHWYCTGSLQMGEKAQVAFKWRCDTVSCSEDCWRDHFLDEFGKTHHNYPA